ncbi:MAG: hypothetical protein KKC19_01200 [Nanoarchaeota archaeon]|nr:hypothetical protein [Nanoarchaeota archaeon]
MEKKKTPLNVNDTCRNWGIFLIIASIIQFALSNIFDVSWASVVLIIGIITLVFRKSWNLALIGGMFLLVGAMNIIYVLTLQTSVFLVAGIIQLGIGVFVLNQYHSIEKKESPKKKGNWFKLHPVLSIFLALLIIWIIYALIPTSTESKIKQSLEQNNYEVLDVHYSEKILGDENWASVKMKSFDDLNKQANEGLTTLSLYYGNADRYTATLFTPTSECYYSIEGAILNSYWESVEGIETNEVGIKDTIAYSIWENYILSGEADYYDTSLYQNLGEKGFDFGVLSSIIDYNIESNTERCS